MTVTTHSNTKCQLGEGLLWHPKRQQLFWFDILTKRLITRTDQCDHHWQFDEHVSAAGWLDQETLLIASESRLFRFDLTTGAEHTVVALEADTDRTRSNDGRADPWGGFWIGTMGKQAEPGLGAIYRYYRGQLRRLYAEISISNAICFAPRQPLAYFTDTATQKIMRQALSPKDGWPEGDAELWLDLTVENRHPDGAVVDIEGCVWNAQWDASRIARYGPDGRFLSAIDFPTRQISCPAFGGNRLQTLYATSAAIGLSETDTQAGHSFCCETGYRGQPEHQVIL